MRAADWKRVVRPLLPDDGWRLHGRVAHRIPVRHVLVGVLGEGSGFSTGVYVWRLRLPLFVPTDVWTLNWSERVGGGARTYSADDGDGLRAALTGALTDAGSEADALKQITSRRKDVNWGMLEAVAGSHVLLGHRRRALRTIDDALAEPRARSWDGAQVDRLAELRDLLSEGDHEGARQLLDRRARASAAALGVVTATG